MASWLRREAMRSSVRAMERANQPVRLRRQGLDFCECEGASTHQRVVLAAIVPFLHPARDEEI